MVRSLTFAAGLLVAFAVSPAGAVSLTPAIVNNAEPDQRPRPAEGLDPLAIKVQVLLDRARFSPGEIDGKNGENVKKAIRAFAAARGLPPDTAMTSELWTKLTSGFEGPILTEYALTEKDVKGPFLEKLPSRLEDMKSLSALSYTSPREAIAEKFHMSEELLAALNPAKPFEKIGAVVIVANVSMERPRNEIGRIEVDKTGQTVKIFDKSGQLVAFYPATVGSDEKPTPGGTLKVTSAHMSPTYRYDPEYDFKGVKTKKPFTIKPGPNNPVGLAWIGLSEKSYGIHGTPQPSKVSKSESQGCVRLTNWDAVSLAGMVKKGMPVAFLEGSQALDISSASPREQKTSATQARTRRPY